MDDKRSYIPKVPSCPQCHYKDNVIKLTAATFKYNRIIVEKVTVYRLDISSNSFLRNGPGASLSWEQETSYTIKTVEPWQGFQKPPSLARIIARNVILLSAATAIVLAVDTLWIKVIIANLSLLLLGINIISWIRNISSLPSWERSFFCEHCGCAFDPLTKKEKCNPDSAVEIKKYNSSVTCPKCLSSDRVLSISKILESEISKKELSSPSFLGWSKEDNSGLFVKYGARPGEKREIIKRTIYSERAFYFSSTKPQWSPEDKINIIKAKVGIIINAFLANIGETIAILVGLAAIIISIVWFDDINIIPLIVGGAIAIIAMSLAEKFRTISMDYSDSLKKWESETLCKRYSRIHYCERCDIIFVPGTKMKGNRNLFSYFLGQPIERVHDKYSTDDHPLTIC